jgi:hypothetical protein
MIDANRLLGTILDRMLQMLPAEPAAFKRLDDIGDAESGFEESELFDSERRESGYRELGVSARALHATS